MAKKTLIIVESPTKANTISKFLGPDCKIIASKGHIRTLPKIGLAIDLKNNYQPEYIIDETKKSVITELKEALKNSDELILATDEDREGESISWHLLEVLKPSIPYRRMVFHEITKKAILEAFENGRDLDFNLVHAQEARRVLDRLYGYTISPVLWSKLSNKSLSAGRVQSPGLRLIVDRERLRMNFKKTQYWDVNVSFKEGFSARLDSYGGKKIATGKDFNSETGEFSNSQKVKLLSQEDSKVISSIIKTSKFEVEDIKETNKVQRPAPPFMTSTLQQEGNRKLHMSAKDTMKVAQNLYEKGFITYMRTDSLVLSDEGIRAARTAVEKLFSKAYVSESPRHYASNSVNAQEAHEAIRPAGENFILPEESGLTGKELALYTLIFKRTLACQMKDAQKVSTSVTVNANDASSTAVFTATGSRIEFPGFIKVYVEGSDEEDQEEAVLPKLTKGQILNVSELKSISHETKEPSRFTEASLVQELEKRGIGRPSTYASIIERILEKQYVVKENGALVPTFTGFGVIQLLEHFKSYIEYSFTSDMEKDLDEIAKGNVKELEYLKNFYEGNNGLEQQVHDIKDTIVPMNVKKIKIEGISEENTVTLGKFGPYIQDKNGKYYSVPETWTPSNTTEAMLEDLKASKSQSSTTPVIGTTPEGLPIFYCTGKFGDYWQIGDKAKTEDVKRFKVPQSLLGKEVSTERILEFFSLPKLIGHMEDGSEITADIGRFGAYLKCNDDYRNIKNAEDIFSTTELEARKIFSMPKPVAAKAKKTASSTKKASTNSSDSAVAVVKDFGTHEGKKLDIRSGRYGFYIKWGEKNFRIPSQYQHSEELCKAMTQEEAVACLK